MLASPAATQNLNGPLYGLNKRSSFKAHKRQGNLPLCMYELNCCTHHMDSSGKQICRLDHLLLLLYLSLQLGSTDLVLGKQDGGRKLRLLLEKQMGCGVL